MDEEEMFLLYDYEDDPPVSNRSTVRTDVLVKEDWSRRVSIPLTVNGPKTDENDGEESPSERKRVMIGPNHQAVVPERAENRDQAVVARERQCESLLWKPSVLPETTVASFLLHAQSRPGDDAYRVRDDEEALWHLMRAHFDSREALKRLSFAVKKDGLPLCGWDQIEQKNFELGMKMYGKNFHLIQSSKVRTRSVGECVCFYYLWKKEYNNAPPPAATRGPGRHPRRRRGVLRRDPPPLGPSGTRPGPSPAPLRDPGCAGLQTVAWGGREAPPSQTLDRPSGILGSRDLQSVDRCLLLQQKNTR